jgi:hypothetical protein
LDKCTTPSAEEISRLATDLSSVQEMVWLASLPKSLARAILLINLFFLPGQELSATPRYTPTLASQREVRFLPYLLFFFIFIFNK